MIIHNSSIADERPDFIIIYVLFPLVSTHPLFTGILYRCHFTIADEIPDCPLLTDIKCKYSTAPICVQSHQKDTLVGSYMFLIYSFYLCPNLCPLNSVMMKLNPLECQWWNSLVNWYIIYICILTSAKLWWHASSP